MELITDAASAGYNCYLSYSDAAKRIGDMIRAPNWKAASETQQKRALITSSKLLDRYVKWYGNPTVQTQTMAWPRQHVQVRDRELGAYLDKDAVPEFLKEITIEYAEALLGEDLIASQETGLSSLSVGGIALNFNQIDRKDVMPDGVKMLAGDYGIVRTGNSAVVSVMRR